MPRMFKGFTEKKENKDKFLRTLTANGMYPHWHGFPLSFHKETVNPNLMGIVAKTQSHCHQHQLFPHPFPMWV